MVNAGAWAAGTGILYTTLTYSDNNKTSKCIVMDPAGEASFTAVTRPETSQRHLGNPCFSWCSLLLS
jgi:hypothetical protein